MKGSSAKSQDNVERADIMLDIPGKSKLSALYWSEFFIAGLLAGLRVPPVNQRSVRSIYVRCLMSGVDPFSPRLSQNIF